MSDADELLEREAAFGVGKPLLDELNRRGDCRYGLYGVLVEEAGKRWRVAGSSWDDKGRLELELVPAEQWDAYRKYRDEQWPPGTAISGTDLMALEEPDYYRSFVPAAGFVLLEPWPVTCGCWLDTGD